MIFPCLSLLVAIFSALTVSCASVDTVKNAPASRGDDRVFDASQDRVYDAAMKTLIQKGFAIESETRHGDVIQIVGSTPVRAIYAGQIVRITIGSVDHSKVNVNVYWRSRFRDGIIPWIDWTKDIFSRMEDLLAR